MEFCIISPTAGLELFATKSKRHMVLAHQYVNDAKYASFYQERKVAGDFIFMDNGAYEGEYNQRIFLAALTSLKPNVACLPDVIMNGKNSRDLSTNFLLKYRANFPSVEWMYIPQGNDMVDYCASISYIPSLLAVNDNRLTWIGITRFLRTHVLEVDHIRVDAAAWIHGRWPDLALHAMGMADGDVNELEHLAAQGFVQSVDSSAPVWRGWKGFNHASWDNWNRSCEVDFSSAIPNHATRRLIWDNLEVCLAASRG